MLRVIKYVTLASLILFSSNVFAQESAYSKDGVGASDLCESTIEFSRNIYTDYPGPTYVSRSENGVVSFKIIDNTVVGGEPSDIEIIFKEFVVDDEVTCDGTITGNEVGTVTGGSVVPDEDCDSPPSLSVSVDTLEYKDTRHVYQICNGIVTIDTIDGPDKDDLDSYELIFNLVDNDTIHEEIVAGMTTFTNTYTLHLCSSYTTTTCGSSTTTTVPVTDVCVVIISPKSKSVSRLETVQFSAEETGPCNSPCYTWEISEVGSMGCNIDNNGLYKAGSSSGTDKVTVKDPCNGDISDTATVIVNGTGTTTTSVCPSGAIYGEHSEQTELLRYFRDNVLTQTLEGREIIKLYYELSPTIVNAMEQDKEFKADVKEMIDGVLELITETE